MLELATSPRLVAVEEQHFAEFHDGRAWRIGVINGPQGGSAWHPGWVEAWFSTYSACVDAIEFIENHGGSYRQYLKQKKTESGENNERRHAGKTIE